MSDLLARVQDQNETWLRKLPPVNTRFRGAIFPVSPSALPTSVFILPRRALRTRLREPVKARDLFHDPFRRVLLVGEHDATFSGDERISRVYSLFQMTRQVAWRRHLDTIDPVTKQPVSRNAFEPLGQIWVSIESYTRGDEDPGVRIITDRVRVITNVELQLGDQVGDRTVKRLNPTLGITVAEIE